MKHLIIISNLFFIALQGFSQGGNLDAYYFNTRYRGLPKNKLEPAGGTYSIKENNGTGVALDLLNSIKLNGFLKADNGKVFLGVSYPFDLRFGDIKVESIKDPNSAGNLYTANRTIETDGRITLECEELKYKRYDLSPYKKTFYTKQYNNEASARNEATMAANDWLKTGLEGFKQFAISQASYYANLGFGYPVLNSKVKVYLLESKKNTEYENFKKNFEIIKAGFAKITADSIPASLETEIKPAIDYFAAIPGTYADSDKGHKKIRYAAYYMLMKIYYHLEQYDKATEYANLIIKNDYDPEDGKSFLDDMSDLKSKLSDNNLKAIHFTVKGEDGYNLYRND